MQTLQLIPVSNMPLVQPGDDLSRLITDAMCQNGQTFLPGDVLVLAQKIVSKAENRFVDLRDVTPSARAVELAQATHKDPRLVEVILWDTAEVVRAKPGVLIVCHTAGFICANAGVDHSNVGPPEAELVLRLPADADASAWAVRRGLAGPDGQSPPVVIIDSHGRPWRLGTSGVAIGVAGIRPVQDLRGQPDMFGVRLQHTDVAVTDQLAAAATLVMGQSTEACPVVIARGLNYEADDAARAADVLRPRHTDLFR